MAKFRNISPLGALDIPALGRIVEAGKVFEVEKGMVQHFADQTANFVQIKTSPRKPAKQKSTPDEPDTGDNQQEEAR